MEVLVLGKFALTCAENRNEKEIVKVVEVGDIFRRISHFLALVTLTRCSLKIHWGHLLQTLQVFEENMWFVEYWTSQLPHRNDHLPSKKRRVLVVEVVVAVVVVVVVVIINLKVY